MGNLIFRIIILSFILLIVRSLLQVSSDAWSVHISSAWPSTTGSTTQTLDNDLIPNAKDLKDNHFLEYKYTVNGQEYIGSRISYTRKHTRSVAEVENLIKMYASAPMLTVYYNPKNPSTAVLQKGGSNFYNITMLCAQIALIVLLLWFLQASSSTPIPKTHN